MIDSMPIIEPDDGTRGGVRHFGQQPSASSSSLNEQGLPICIAMHCR